MSQLVDVYPYKITGGDPVFFAGRRSTGKIYSGQWRMVGGKVEEGESAWQAAYRELHEELGVKPARFWSPPTLNQFYEPASDTVHHIPVFAAEIQPEVAIQLNEEHSEFQWLTIDQVDRYIHWPEQVRIMHFIHKIISEKNIIKEWEISIRQ